MASSWHEKVTLLLLSQKDLPQGDSTVASLERLAAQALVLGEARQV
jgi:hypothetical protein